jgi:hypothetical protein
MNSLKGDDETESATSEQVTCYSHCHEKLHCFDDPSFMLNVRDPMSVELHLGVTVNMLRM